MGMRLTKPWVPIREVLEGTGPVRVHGEMGVYQLADEAGEVLFVGYAGGRSPFGLRGEIAGQSAKVEGAVSVRFEVTTAYLTRYQELLMLHLADHATLPPHHPPIRLGRLSPA